MTELKSIDDYIAEYKRIRLIVQRSDNNNLKRDLCKRLKRITHDVRLYDKYRGTKYAEQLM